MPAFTCMALADTAMIELKREENATAIARVTVAAGAFGLFMLLALYLLAAKAENDLRDINDSIRSFRPASTE